MPLDPAAFPDSATARVRALVRQALDEGRSLPDAEEVSRRLAFSTGHMRRLLRSEGSTLTGIRDAALAEEAVAALERGEAVAHVSKRLGFAEPSSFRRAFKRWTGRRPTDTPRN